jgi:hypothetical protein
MNDNKVIGFIYRIDYIGSNDKIKGLSYAGSKKTSSKLKWESYYGSPSKKNCEKCEAWNVESKINPNDFKKEIIKEVYEGDSITKNEIEYMKSVSNDIKNDPKWLNAAIPRLGAFPEFVFSESEMKKREIKRKNTIKKMTGNENGSIINIEKRRKTCIAKYGVSHFNKTETGRKNTSIRKKKYFSSMSEEERKAHGQKSLQGRDPKKSKITAQKGAETRKNFSEEKKIEIQNKRKEKWYAALKNRNEEQHKIICEKYRHNSYFYQKNLYVTLENLENSIIESKFVKDWESMGIPRDSIQRRIKNNSKAPIYSRKNNPTFRVLNHCYMSRYEASLMT